MEINEAEKWSTTEKISPDGQTMLGPTAHPESLSPEAVDEYLIRT